MNNSFVQYLWLIPAFPLAASLLILFLARTRRMAAGVAISGQVCALILAVVAFGWSIQAPRLARVL